MVWLPLSILLANAVASAVARRPRWQIYAWAALLLASALGQVVFRNQPVQFRAAYDYPFYVTYLLVVPAIASFNALLLRLPVKPRLLYFGAALLRLHILGSTTLIVGLSLTAPPRPYAQPILAAVICVFVAGFALTAIAFCCRRGRPAVDA